MADTQTAVDDGTRRQIIEKVAHALESYYVFPEVARQMGERLRSGLAAGDYDSLAEPLALCERLTTDLQAICRDKHVRVRYSEEPRQFGLEESSPEERAEGLATARRENFGFYKVERLAGNVGYLDVRTLWDAGVPGAGDVAVAAMNLLAHTDALVIDLRKNGGGSPTMIALLISFLFGPRPVHLNSFYEREGDKTTQFWTLSYVPGPRTPDKPVFVLTGKRTFSGAEEFAYNLKHLKRATLVGETTGGGAHPGDDISVTPHFRVFVPSGRAINPISGTNWEGTGVEPDIEVPEEEAFDRAYRLALQTVLDKLGEAPTMSARELAEEARAALAVVDG